METNQRTSVVLSLDELTTILGSLVNYYSQDPKQEVEDIFNNLKRQSNIDIGTIQEGVKKYVISDRPSILSSLFNDLEFRTDCYRCKLNSDIIKEIINKNAF